MIPPFKIGDKVVCIDDSYPIISGGKPIPIDIKKNVDYVIENCHWNNLAKCWAVYLIGCLNMVESNKNTRGFTGYRASRFRKLDDNFANQVEKAIFKKIEEEYLVPVYKPDVN